MELREGEWVLSSRKRDGEWMVTAIADGEVMWTVKPTRDHALDSFIDQVPQSIAQAILLIDSYVRDRELERKDGHSDVHKEL